MLNDYQPFATEGEQLYTFDFNDALLDSVTVTACVFSISPQSGSPLSPSLSLQVDDFGNNKSTIKVSGIHHGATHLLQAKATLSNSEIIVKDAVLIGFNG
jgi:hypothetical protein